MNATVITCPHCNKVIPLTEALPSHFHAQNDVDYQARFEAAVADAERRKQQELKTNREPAQNAYGKGWREIASLIKFSNLLILSH